MKTCTNCGKENQDNAKFCKMCGKSLQETVQSDAQSISSQNNNPAHPIDFNPNNQQQNYQQTEYQQQNTYPTNYTVVKHKKVWLAVILDIIGGLISYFLIGIGQLYLGLYKRGFFLCLLGLIPVVINIVCILTENEFSGSLISLLMGILLLIYSTYDAYLCTNAINEGRTIPLLFGSLDIQ